MKETKLTKRRVSSLCMELALLLHAGMGPADAVQILLEPGGAAADASLSAMAEALDRGVPLSDAMETSRALPGEVCALVRVGERTGRQEEALRALSETYDARERLETRLRGALLYPCVLLVLMLAVVGVLLVRVLPVFDEVFRSLGGSMTGVAGGLLALGRAMDAALPVLLALLAAVVALLAAFAVWDGFRERAVALLRRRFGSAALFRTADGARFAQAMAMGLRSGLPVEEALELAAPFLETPAAARRCEQARSVLAGGGGLTEALELLDVLPPAYCRMLSLGVRGGSADTVMEEIARRMQEDSESAIERWTGRVEPTLVVATSLLVGAILLCVMLPLMNIMAAIG